jgi:hypothetical protein
VTVADQTRCHPATVTARPGPDEDTHDSASHGENGITTFSILRSAAWSPGRVLRIRDGAAAQLYDRGDNPHVACCARAADGPRRFGCSSAGGEARPKHR